MDTLENESVPDFGEDPLDQTEKGPEASSENSVDEGRSAAILAYIPFMCFVPLTKMRDNKFALHHGRQGLVLLMLEILAVLFFCRPLLTKYIPPPRPLSSPLRPWEIEPIRSPREES